MLPTMGTSLPSRDLWPDATNVLRARLVYFLIHALSLKSVTPDTRDLISPVQTALTLAALGFESVHDLERWLSGNFWPFSVWQRAHFATASQKPHDLRDVAHPRHPEFCYTLRCTRFPSSGRGRPHCLEPAKGQSARGPGQVPEIRRPHAKLPVTLELLSIASNVMNTTLSSY